MDPGKPAPFDTHSTTPFDRLRTQFRATQDADLASLDSYHQRNKNAWDDLQRTGQLDTSRLARLRYTTLVTFCQEKAGRLPTESTEPVATWPSVRRDAILSYSLGNRDRSNSEC
jgi:hypothetical protein